VKQLPFMKKITFLFVAAMILVTSSFFLHPIFFSQIKHLSVKDNPTIIHPSGKSVSERFKCPDGYERVELPDHSFGSYLRNFPLKPHGSDVFFYNGKKKNLDVHDAVLDIDIGNKDLQQCADAIMRLYAEHLFEQGKQEEIGFHFTSGFFCDYPAWRSGKRIQVNGNHVKWISRAGYDDSYETFRKYLEQVFIYAGTLSMSSELKHVPFISLMPGDVFVQGGSPGHAVVVIDAAINEKGDKIYMLAQSYMPAQNIHILKNFHNPSFSPWYELSPDSEYIETPEWTFRPEDLKRFPVVRK
jgi:hypothetical protein